MSDQFDLRFDVLCDGDDGRDESDPNCRCRDDGLTGFLCKPRDAGSLADAMAIILDLEGSQLEAMGRAAREKVMREFDQQLVFGHYLTASDTRSAERADRGLVS